jgi:oligopeptide/dipeptide ABC transporter ATP-binding protein
MLNLLMDLQREFKLTYLFIAHDLSVVQRVSDRIVVMYLGQFAEVAPRDRLYSTPRHPYSRALLSAVPIPDPDASDRRTQVLLAGDQPSPANPPSGCRFHSRCPRAQERCKAEVPRLRPAWDDPPTHLVACHYPLRDGEQLVDRPGRPTGATDRGAAT